MISLLHKTILQFDIYLAPVGLICCLVIFAYFITTIYRATLAFLLPRLIAEDLRFYGEWAVVTGGSSGIGKSYAHQLARRGFNIIIISNEIEELKVAARDIESQHGVKCYYIVADFTESLEVFDRVRREMAEKDVGILVNGAGIAGKSPCYFLEESEENILAMINLHIGAVMNMTSKILPPMLSKNKGVIVNISSLVSVMPLPLFSVYASCKAFSDRFTRALYWEFKNNNFVLFQSLLPGLVITRLVGRMNFPRTVKILGTKCNTFTASAVNTISATNHTSGYWIHGIGCFLVQLLPVTLLHKMLLFFYSLLVFRK